MILVPNLRRPLSGSKWLFRSLVFLISLGSISSCIPRGQVMSPQPQEPEEVIVEAEKPEEEVRTAPVVHEVALILPFQLNRSGATVPTAADLQRAELALDFYQGFKLGLEKQTARGAHFKLHVLDSRDSEDETRVIARSADVQNAALVVGPVYPKEIEVFGATAGLEASDVLQISPLAATMPTAFNLSNLVSITSPIMTHIRAVAARIVDTYEQGDVVLLYETNESSSQQFLGPLRNLLRELNPAIPLHSVQNEERLQELARIRGTNLVVSGSTNRFQVIAMMDQLRNLRDQTGVKIRVFGHPNWAKISLPESTGMESFQTTISSTYYIDSRKTAVQDFKEWYQSEYDVEPNEFAFKGYDAGMYFGGLLARYGRSYRDYLVKTEFEGLHNSFEFQYHSQWGFVNQAVHFLHYRQGQFVR